MESKYLMRTETLQVDENPTAVVCLGHVNEKQFNEAFKNEGWSELGDYSFSDEHNPLRHEYWIVGGNDGHWKQSSKDDPKAEPVTVANWD